METAQSPPAKIARFAETGLMMMMGGRESSENSIALDLGLGCTGFTHGKSVFTFLQLQELEHQALIFKHMAAGVPVPFHLVLPIWKSLSNSYDLIHASSGIYPSFLGCKGVYFDYRNSMEPEPGRCRRTDGKKWRCSKDVVPDQKYCERHMHRGRNRSRKPVETPISSSTSQVQVMGTTTTTSSSNLTNDSNTNLSISIPLQLMPTTITSTATTTSTTNNITEVSPSLGFSPKSVLLLQRGRGGGGGGGGTCKTDQ